MTMTIGSLFSGYAGLDMAVETVTGARTAWFSDIDPGASKILAHHWPDIPNLGDITKIDWSQVEPVDVITGGFPCQDLSLAGKRRGMAGARSGLWSHMATAIATLRPQLVIAENVRGLLSAEAHSDVEPCSWCVGDGTNVDMRALGAVLADLADIGYDARWCGLRAADVGAPHGRFRVFVVAEPAENADRSTGREWRESAPGQAESGRAWPNAGRRGGTPSADTDPSRWEGHRPLTASAQLDDVAGDQPALADTASDRWVQGWPESAWQQGRSDAAERSDSTLTDAIGGGRDGRARDEIGEAQQRTTRAGSGETNWGQYGPAIRQWERILGRPAPAPTAAGTRGGQSLSPAFVEFMMGLPAGHVTDVPGLTRNEQLKALGNGVVPQQAQAAIRYLLPATARQLVNA